MSPQWIEVDDEVIGLVKAEAEPFVDSPNQAIRRLLGLMATDRQDLASTPAPFPAQHRRRAPTGSLLPLGEYELPILQAIAKRGGRALSGEVLVEICEALEGRLTDLDRESYRCGQARWRLRAAQARLRLVQRGLLKAGSPRGIWELTEAGIEELERLEAQAERREREAAR